MDDNTLQDLEKEITIVIATYNGEKYLTEQLNSIISNSEFSRYVKEIIITDDNSKDGTVDIINNYLGKYDFFKYMINRSPGVVNNFRNGLLEVKSKYIMLSDQDDVWRKDKISTMVSEIKKIDLPDRPALVFSDSYVTDDKLMPIHNSFFEMNNIVLGRDVNFDRLLINNVCQGGVMIFNDVLMNVFLKYKFEKSAMHDWVLLLTAIRYGNVSYSKEKLIYYRLHSSNVLGRQKKTFLQKLCKPLIAYNNYIVKLQSVIAQANEFFINMGLDKSDITHIFLIRNEKGIVRKIILLLGLYKVNSILKKNNFL